jgi:hypothetical protein
VDFQAGGSKVSFEFRDTFGVTAQQRFNNRYGLVSASQPDYFGRVTVMSGHFREIRILRDEHKIRVLGTLPND